MKYKEGGTNTVLLSVVVLMALVVTTAWCANNDPPSGWGMFNRDRAKWAMGKPLFLLCSCPTTSTVTNDDIEVGDYVAGILNLDDTDDTPPALTAITITDNTITATGTPFTTGEAYAVVIWKSQSDPR